MAFPFHIQIIAQSKIGRAQYQVTRAAHYLLNCVLFKFYLWFSNLQNG